MNKAFEYKVFKDCGTISDNGIRRKALRIIQYAKTPAVYDIRIWTTDDDGDEKMLKGICLNAEELSNLQEILAGIEDPFETLSQYRTEKKRGGKI